MPRLGHRRDRGRVDLVAGFGSARPGDRRVTGELGEEPHRHLRAAGVVGAQEQHGGFAIAGSCLPPWPMPEAVDGRTVRPAAAGSWRRMRGWRTGRRRSAGTVRWSRRRTCRRTRVCSRVAAVLSASFWSMDRSVREVCECVAAVVGHGCSVARVGCSDRSEMIDARGEVIHGAVERDRSRYRAGSGIDQWIAADVGRKFLVGVVAHRDRPDLLGDKTSSSCRRRLRRIGRSWRRAAATAPGWTSAAGWVPAEVAGTDCGGSRLPPPVGCGRSSACRRTPPGRRADASAAPSLPALR